MKKGLGESRGEFKTELDGKQRGEGLGDVFGLKKVVRKSVVGVRLAISILLTLVNFLKRLA